MENSPEAQIRLPCSGLTPIFFSWRPDDIAYARRLCLSCELRDACIDGAIERHEPDGVWGGFLINYGKIVVFKRVQGHPTNEDPNALDYDSSDVPERHLLSIRKPSPGDTKKVAA